MKSCLPSCTFVNHKSRLNLIPVITYESLPWVICMSHGHLTINKHRLHTHHINYFLHSCLFSCNLWIIRFKSIWNKCISSFQFCYTPVFRFWGCISGVKVNFWKFRGWISVLNGPKHTKTDPWKDKSHGNTSDWNKRYQNWWNVDAFQPIEKGWHDHPNYKPRSWLCTVGLYLKS